MAFIFMGLQFNSHSDGQDICTIADVRSKTNSTSFPLKEKATFANEALRIIWQDIFFTYGGWIYDDNNQADLPEAITDLASGQRFYQLPIDSSSLLGVEFKNQGGTWITLTPITLEKIKQNGYAETEFYKTSATPMFYRPVANGIDIYPAANWTATASLKIHISRDMTSFLSTDTTKVPGFDAPFHYGIPIYLSLKYAQKENLTTAGGTAKDGSRYGFDVEWQAFRIELRKHYSERFRQMFPPRIRVIDSTRDFM